jgi:exosome complex component RRP42
MEDYSLELIRNGKRIDGRDFYEFRKIEVKNNFIQKAEGSCRLKLGSTEVIAGVKIELGEPFPDTPNEGTLSVNAEFSPIASPDFEPGPPGEDATELARVVDRGIRESNCIELEKLCIKPGEQVFSVFIDLEIVNHKGNLLDACALAAVNALWNTRLPKVENDKIVRGEYVGKLPVVWKPINITVCKVDDKFLLDPILEEENVIDAKLSIAVRDDDKICSLQKQGKGTIKFDEIERMLDIAIEKSKELRKYVVVS